MTLSEKCETYGLTIKVVSTITNTSRFTLHNWVKSKPLLLDAILIGCQKIVK